MTKNLRQRIVEHNLSGPHPDPSPRELIKALNDLADDERPAMDATICRLAAEMIDQLVASPVTIDLGQLAIQEVCDDLTKRLADKGYPDSHAEIWIGRDNRKCAVITDTRYGRTEPKLPYSGYHMTVSRAVEAARNAIAALPDPHALDAWFDPNAPINQPAVQEAAE